MKKILVISNLEKGVGISKYVINTYAKISAKTSQLKFVFVNDQERNDYVNELNNLHISVVNIPKLTRHPLGYLFHWTRFIILHHSEFSAIHFHYDSMVRFYPILIASVFGMKNIIVHSHNGSSSVVTSNVLRLLLHKFGRRMLKQKIDYKFAVSDKAAEWMFKTIDGVEMIHNGVNTDLFAFSEDVRKKKRNQLHLQDSLVVGHIGRFKKQKNHEFLLAVFYEMLKTVPSAKLLLIGDGPLQSEIQQKALNLGIQDSVYFLGMRNDVNELLDAMDIMVFPSLYEGFPITMVEAQWVASRILCK